MAENNENKNDMLEALDSIEQVKVGDVVKGEVLAIDDDRQAIVGIKDAGLEGHHPGGCSLWKNAKTMRENRPYGKWTDS